MGQNREFGGGAKSKEEILKAILINSVGQSLRARSNCPNSDGN
jgi:hypothetical protein